MDIEELLKRHRKKPLADAAALEGQPSFSSLSLGVPEIERLIPHRDPFRLVDRLTGLSLAEGEETVFGERFLDPAEPVFRGHFPEFPLYPGCLQLEMGGQLGLCLTHFFVNKTDQVPADATPVPVRVTRVLGALFLSPLLPGKTATLIARKLSYDGYFGTVLCQVLDGPNVCSVSAAEVLFLQE